MYPKFKVLFLVLALSSMPLAHAGSACDDCGITPENLFVWQNIDPSGNGFLSSADLVLFRRAFDAITQLTMTTTISIQDVIDAINNQTDLNGDGVWNGKDQQIADALFDYMIARGALVIDYNSLQNCLSAVILGSCG